MLQKCKLILKQINYIQLVTFVAEITDGIQVRTTLVPQVGDDNFRLLAPRVLLKE